jgi:hypothetical protein
MTKNSAKYRLVCVFHFSATVASLEWTLRILQVTALIWTIEPTGPFGNEPFGSRPEPGAYLPAPNLQLPPGEVPEGRARGVQDTATQVQSESEG